MAPPCYEGGAGGRASTLRLSGGSDSESDDGYGEGSRENALLSSRLAGTALVGSLASAVLLCILASSKTTRRWAPRAATAPTLAAEGGSGYMALDSGFRTPASSGGPIQVPAQMLPTPTDFMAVSSGRAAPAPGGGAAEGGGSMQPLPQQAEPSEGSEVQAQQAQQAQQVQQVQQELQREVPQEHLHDGNKCADDEEEHLGLCYEKCADLTQGVYKFRQSAWTCCNKKICDPLSLIEGRCCRHHMGFCSGFDIAGMKEGDKVCPHKPGACLRDEELFLDLCFLKCSLLTKQELPHRVGAATCCGRSDMSCLLDKSIKVAALGQAKTSAAFNVGGGCGSDPNATASASAVGADCRPHEPQQRLTEAT